MSRTHKFRTRLNLHSLEQRDVPSTTLLKDINPGALFSSYPAGGVVFNGQYYFTATDQEHGRELWRTDGSAAGTQIAADINPGSGSSSPDNITIFNGKLFFSADGGQNHGIELWSYDSSGYTQEILDARPGSDSSVPKDLIVVNNLLFFTAYSSQGEELWRSNGSDLGTYMVKDINSNPNAGGPNHLTNFNGTLYFSAQDVTGDFELWKSDGTNVGTTRVKDINPGSSGSVPSELTVMNGKLFFVATTASAGRELWTSDGTSNGTVMIRDINAGVDDSSPADFTVVNNTLYFRARTATNGNELWKTDGTLFGTVSVKDIRPGVSSSSPFNITNVNGTLFFAADDGVHGTELWKSDGTSAGTVMVKDLTPGANDTNFYVFTNVNGTLYFPTNVFASQLWKSDGTDQGTVLLKDFGFNNNNNGFINVMGAVNGNLYFSAKSSATQGNEMWVTTASRPIEHMVIGADAGQLPQVRVYDKNTQNVVMNLFAYDPSFKGGVRVAVGDVTGDGVDDIVTAAGAGGGPHVKVFDGVTGTVKKEFFAYSPNFTGGVFVAVGDFNNDGYADIVTGAGAGGGPHVKVFDGKSLGVITEFFAFNATFTGGVNVGTGDINGDGYSDLIFAAGPGGGPHVRVVSGKDNTTELRSFFAYDAAFNGGVNVAAGDLNGDGYDDLIVSQASKGNRIHTYSGKDNTLINDFAAGKASYTGGVRVASGDNNHDGYDDLFSFANDDTKIAIYCRSAGSPNTFVGGLSTNDPGFLGGVFVGV